MKQLLCCIQIDILKFKRTYALALAVLAPLFISSLFTVIYFFKGIELLRGGTNGMENYMDFSMNIASGLLFPFYIILLAVLIHQIEYKASSLKDLFSYPVSYLNTYLSKWIVTILLLLLSLMLYFVFSMIGGWIVSMKYPDLYHFENTVVVGFIKQIVFISLSSFFMMAIQFILSLRWSNVIVPFGVGLVGFISAMVLLNGWKFVHLHPYALSIMSYHSLEGTMKIGINHFLIYSSAGFLILSVIGYFVWYRRRIA